MYTTVVNAYLLFLKFIEKNDMGPKVKFDAASFNEEFLNDIKTGAKEYSVHIEHVYNNEAQRLRDEMFTIARKYHDIYSGERK